MCSGGWSAPEFGVRGFLMCGAVGVQVLRWTGGPWVWSSSSSSRGRRPSTPPRRRSATRTPAHGTPALHAPALPSCPQHHEEPKLQWSPGGACSIRDPCPRLLGRPWSGLLGRPWPSGALTSLCRDACSGNSQNRTRDRAGAPSVPLAPPPLPLCSPAAPLQMIFDNILSRAIEWPPEDAGPAEEEGERVVLSPEAKDLINR